MAWITENRRTETIERRAEPYLTDDMKIDLAKKYFPRYPTKRACLLPVLHAVQHHYNWIPTAAMEEVEARLTARGVAAEPERSRAADPAGGATLGPKFHQARAGLPGEW